MHTSVCRHPACWYVVQIKQVYVLSEDDVVIVTEGKHPGSKNEIIKTVLLSTCAKYGSISTSFDKIELIGRFFGSDWLESEAEGWVNL